MSTDCPPVLVLAFNRPEVLRRVLDAVAAGAPRRLYVAADGPRAEATHPTDAAACASVRELMMSPPWECEVRTRFLPANQGCGRAVSGAVSWFFEQEESGIILEDDTVPAADFFPFCAEVLARYAVDPRVMSVRASRYSVPAISPGHSWSFSRYFDCHGWASWRRAWSKYHFDIRGWRERAGDPSLAELGTTSAHCWTRRFAAIEREDPPRNWARQWHLAHFLNSGLSVVPSVNLVSHIGSQKGAANMKRMFVWEHNPCGSIQFPLRAPLSVEVDEELDVLHERWRNNHRPWLARKFWHIMRRYQIGSLAWRRGGVGPTLA